MPVSAGFFRAGAHAELPGHGAACSHGFKQWAL